MLMAALLDVRTSCGRVRICTTRSSPCHDTQRILSVSNEPPDDLRSVTASWRTARDQPGQPGGPAPRAGARRACCRRRPSGSTRAASCGPTRCGSGWSGSTWTRRRSGSSSARTAATATPSARRCWTIVAARGKMQNPVTGSGGMLVGTVEEVGPESPLGLAVGRPGRHAGLADADAAGDRGRAGPLGRHVASRSRATATRSCSAGRSRRCCPTTCRAELSLAVMDVCGAPALTARVVAAAVRDDAAVVAVRRRAPARPASLSLAAAGRPERARPSASCRTAREADLLSERGAGRRGHGRRRPRPGGAVATAVEQAGGPADVTVVCVDVPGCEGGAILATAAGRDRDLLLDGHLVQRRGARRRGAGRGRHDAGRQRLHARARRRTRWTLLRAARAGCARCSRRRL